MKETDYAHDLNAERALLGVILAFDRLVPALTIGLTRGCFYRLEHQTIFDAAVSVAEEGTVCDLVTVGQRLRDRGQLDAVGAPYFFRLVDGVPKPDDTGLRWQVDRLRAFATAREATRAITELEAALSGYPQDVAATIQDAVATLEAIASPIRKDRPALDGLGQYGEMLADLTRDKGEAIRFGFTGLDDQIPGIYPGEVLGIMARPGIGKTLVLGHLMRQCAGLSHAVFSLEMPAAQIAARLARNIYGVTRHDLEARARTAQLGPDRYVEATRGLMLLDAPGLSVAQMDGQLRALAAGPFRSDPVRVVTIDHLGLLGGDRSMSTYDRVSTQAREIKELAKRHRCAVVLAIQVNREQGGDGSRELTLGAARDSGVVEEAVDYLVALRRLDRSRDASQEQREKFRDVIFAKVLKNRHGLLGDEIAIRLNGIDLTLAEDPYLKAEESELRDLLARGRGRR